MHSRLVGLNNDTRHDERGAAQFKEVVGSAHLVHLKDASKDVTEGAFSVIGRFHIGRTDGQLGLGQRLNISLAIGCHRHFLQLQVGRGHHVLGQALGDFGLQILGFNLSVGCVVGTQVLFVIDFAYEDDNLFETINLEHHVLYLAQLDAQTTQLNLVVGTSQNDDIAIGKPLGIVTRLVDARAVVVHKPLAGHFIQIVIAVSHAAATNVEFTNDTNGQLIAVLIHDKLNDVQLRLAHGHHGGMGQFLVVRSHRNLSGTVTVEDAGLGDLAELFKQLVREFLTTRAHNINAADGITEVLTREPCHPS